ncbi:MAG: bifunctional UDP-N-acetylmuramoyl-tripeptide:D-alanyl-D-alanine ligase/alanine racemase, partial [Chryseobacterium sp.]
MHSIHFSAIAEILSASLLEPGTDPLIENLLTDSRTLLFPETTAFFAISSAQRNANEFIPQLYENGVRAFIIDESFPTEDIDKFPDAGFILVQNTVLALQNLARHYRHTFNYPVIGITGSNGKTIVKEWLYQLMHAEYNIVRSPKSYNSQIGVPVSVWQMNDTHTLGIFEAGISKPGEMEQIAPVIAANIGIVTFIGEAHAKGFADSRQKINEKLLLFQQSEQLIYCKDDD